MKAKTIAQQDAVVLSKEIPVISDKQYFWMTRLLDKFIYARKNDFTCCECGHVWPRTYRMLIEKTYRCPNCHVDLCLLEGRNRTYKQYTHATILDTHRRYQVIRHFYMEKHTKAGQKPEYLWNEIVQHWIDRDGNHAVMSVPPGPYWQSFSKFNIMKLYHLRDKHLIDTYTYPKKKFIKELYRNGFSGDYHDYYMVTLFSTLMKYPGAETSFKAGDMDTFKWFAKEGKRMHKYWHSYVICKRHNYKIEKIGDWLDHMDTLKYLGKDTHNPQYICPKDFNAEHTRWTRKRMVIEKKRGLERLLSRLVKDDEKYRKERSKFMRLKFKGKNIVIVVFNSVSELRIESEMLGHCAYTNKYHKKQGSLMMSARIDNAPIETIYFDLKTMAVQQSRGQGNTYSEYHKEILRVVESNTHKIRTISENRKNLKQKSIA